MIPPKKNIIGSEFLCIVLVCALPLACSKKDGAQTEEGKKALKEAKAITEQGYSLKQEGQNTAALSKFQHAKEILEAALGKTNSPVASSIDDMATVHMRTGDYKNARKRYLEAIEILEKCEPKDPRLASSTKRRLATLDALEAQNIVCDEPMNPNEPGEKEPSSPLPYAPNTEEVLQVFGKMNKHISSCVKGPQRVVTTWVVLSGRGQIIRAEVRSTLKGTEEADCIEKRIHAIGSDFSSSFPRFSACFKNYNYPFLLGN